MSGWNYRLFKDTVETANGAEVERIRFVEVWYDDKGEPNGLGDKVITFEQFGEVKDQVGTFDFNRITYDPIDEAQAKEGIKFTLVKLLEALDKPILTAADVKGLRA